jgi:outer membrane immunogenic protein
MFRTALLASALAACAVPAFAAPAGSWAGFYAGINGGYGGDKFVYPVNGVYTPGEGTPTSLDASASQTSSGFLGGGQIGYNFQTGGFVWGAEADIDAADIKGETSLSGVAGGSVAGTGAADITSKLNYLGTVRGRLGMPIADGRFAPYVAGGLAYGQVESSLSANLTGVGSFAGSRTVDRTGWTVGVGTDYAITDKISFRAEYMYVDLGTDNLLSGTIPVGGGDVTGTVGVKTTANIVRVGVNYRF